MTPEWLKDHLTEVGRWNADGISRQARVQYHGCGTLVIFGLDARVCGLPAMCDTTPLDAYGEAIARLTGRRTYDVFGATGRLELERRDAFRIVGSPPGRRDEPVVAEHRCGQSLPPGPETFPYFRRRYVMPVACPF